MQSESYWSREKKETQWDGHLKKTCNYEDAYIGLLSHENYITAILHNAASLQRMMRVSMDTDKRVAQFEPGALPLIR